MWDCITGSCLFTLGSSGDDQASIGHTEKINAMTVNCWQSFMFYTYIRVLFLFILAGLFNHFGIILMVLPYFLKCDLFTSI